MSFLQPRSLRSFPRLSLRNPASHPSLARYRRLATTSTIAQTLIEKIVQSYAVDVPEGKKVRAGDYVMIKPQHV